MNNNSCNNNKQNEIFGPEGGERRREEENGEGQRRGIRPVPKHPGAGRTRPEPNTRTRRTVGASSTLIPATRDPGDRDAACGRRVEHGLPLLPKPGCRRRFQIMKLTVKFLKPSKFPRFPFCVHTRAALFCLPTHPAICLSLQIK